jgi:hypothetical protein
VSDFKLTPADRMSPLWRALHEHLTNRLATLRAQNDADATPEKTARLRGQIAEVKALLAMNEEPRRPAN